MPFGVLVLLTNALTLVFGNGETSDFWVDALQVWWCRVRSQYRGIRQLVIYLDNGPQNSGRRRQFLKRMVGFADWSGLVVRLVYYPPYHSKYNCIERCWSALEKKWKGVLLSCWAVILACALRMRWCGRQPTVERLTKTYPKKVRVSKRKTCFPDHAIPPNSANCATMPPPEIPMVMVVSGKRDRILNNEGVEKGCLWTVFGRASIRRTGPLGCRKCTARVARSPTGNNRGLLVHVVPGAGCPRHSQSAGHRTPR